MAWIDVDQNSVDWLHQRCACVTASHMVDVCAKLKRKDGEAAARLNYKKAKVAEQLTGLSLESYVSPAMEWGMDNEPLARAAYEIETGVDVLPGGLYVHDEIPRFMASPDGRVGDDGLLEIKCPSSVNHIDFLIEQVIPEEYELQMLAQMACSGRQWVDYVSFDPRMPKEYKIAIKRFHRDPARISALELEVVQFLSEVVAMLKSLGDLKARERAAQSTVLQAPLRQESFDCGVAPVEGEE